jgi:hypothetical protein
LFMVQRCKFSIELKNFPPDLSGEPLSSIQISAGKRKILELFKFKNLQL